MCLTEEIETIRFLNVFSKSVWSGILSRLELSSQCDSWTAESELAGSRFQGGSLVARVGRLAFNVTVIAFGKKETKVSLLILLGQCVQL